MNDSEMTMEIEDDAMRQRREFKETILDPSSKIARTIVEQMLENFDLFMEGYDEQTPEQKEDLDNRRREFAINLLGLIASTGIPSDYASFGVEKIKLALEVIKDTMDACIKSWNKEILSRVIGSKSTLDGGLNVEYATVKEHMNALIKLREETGGMDTYIIPKK